MKILKLEIFVFQKKKECQIQIELSKCRSLVNREFSLENLK